MTTARLIAYGASAKGAGHANSTAACNTNTTGTQLLATDNGAVFAFATSDDAGHKVFLSKVASPSGPSDMYTNSDGYAADQVIYVVAQDLESIFGNISNAGFYTLSLDDSFGNAAFFTTLAEDGQVTLPTVCATTYTFGTDAGSNKATDPEGCDDCKGSGPVISRMANINADYGKKHFEGKTQIEQVPFSLQTAGPFSLKFRNAYRVTTGDKADE